MVVLIKTVVAFSAANSRLFPLHPTRNFCSSSHSKLISRGSSLPSQVADMSEATTKCNVEELFVLYPDGRNEKRGFLEDTEALIFDCDGTLVIELSCPYFCSKSRLSSFVTPLTQKDVSWPGGFYANVARELASHMCAFQHPHDRPRLPSPCRPTHRGNAAEHLQGAADRGTPLSHQCHTHD